MKLTGLSLFFLLFSVMLVLPAKVFSQDQFEGKVTFNIYDNGESQTVQYYAKGGKLRFDANEEGRQGQIVMDPVSKQFMIIMPQQKMYMVMQIPDMKNDNMDSETKDNKGDFVKTGETKNILGYTAQKWTYTDGDDKGEAWMTKEIGGFQFFNNPMQKDKPEWEKDLAAEGYFPLLVNENGEKVFEVTNIEKQSLDDSMFEAPAGYQKMDMPSMMQQK
jgi:hypothetical protein